MLLGILIGLLAGITSTCVGMGVFVGMFYRGQAPQKRRQENKDCFEDMP